MNYVTITHFTLLNINDESFYPTNKQHWREWLEENHLKRTSVWLIYYKKNSGIPSISWSEAVDEALCFGWIDSTKKTLDKDSFTQFFSKRKAVSTWSKINKEKVDKLIKDGLMTEAGHFIIELAKQNGSWNMLDEVENLTIPEDLEKEFNIHKGSREFFLSLSKSVRKIILYWIVSAKRAETRQKRVVEIAEKAALGLKPKNLG